MCICKCDGHEVVDMSWKASETGLIAHKAMEVHKEDSAKPRAVHGRVWNKGLCRGRPWVV
jgi:hypothetical protein